MDLAERLKFLVDEGIEFFGQWYIDWPHVSFLVFHYYLIISIKIKPNTCVEHQENLPR